MSTFFERMMTFDESFYLSQNLDVASAVAQGIFASGLDHFVRHGGKEFRNPNALFDTAYYSVTNPDVNSAVGQGLFTSAFEHFQLFGLAEGRIPSEAFAAFDPEVYLEANPDVAEAVALGTMPSAFFHYVVHGADEGRPGFIDPVDDGQTFYLTVGQDVITGTSGDDLFIADVVQNPMGAQVNTLATGDRLDGGAGLDSLYAQVTAGANYGFIGMPIQPRTTDIEVVKLEAMNAFVFGGIIGDVASSIGLGNTDVYVNAKHMWGVEQMWSWESNGNLTIKDMTTLADDGMTKRTTDAVTIGMAYTGNSDSYWDESNYKVYFDKNYLIAPEEVARDSQIVVELRDMLEGPETETPLGELPVDGIRFFYNEDEVVLRSDAIFEAKTYEELRDAIEDAAREVGLDVDGEPPKWLVEFGEEFTDSLGNPGIQIVITSVEGFELSNPVFTFTEQETGDFDLFGRLRVGDPLVDETLITSNVVLEKVGKGGDGGELVIGSMDKDYYGEGDWNIWSEKSPQNGIEKMNVTVLGDSSKPSSLSGLRSTNNTLQEVYIASEVLPGRTDFADLTIGNSNTWEVYDNFSWAYPFGMPTGLKDVRILDATDFLGDLSVTAAITWDSIPKYLDLMDDQADPAADNIHFSYVGGAGNDSIELHVDGAVAAHEDFGLRMNGGAGDDFLYLEFDFSGNQLANQQMLQAQQQQVHIYDVEGDNTVWAYGEGDVKITTGAGDDTIFTDNSGGTAQWIFNAVGQTSEGTPLSPALLFMSKLTVTFSGADVGGGVTWDVAEAFENGFESTVTIPTTLGNNYYGDQRHVNQALKDAINNDPVLSKLLVAYDGPNNTLIVESLIDGTFQSDDIQITIEAPTWGDLTSAQRTGLLAAVRQFEQNSEITHADIWGSETPDDDAELLYDISGLGVNSSDVVDETWYQNLDTSGIQSLGWASTADTNNIINSGAGNDVIVLSTSDKSSDTIVFTGSDIGHNTIVNFVQEVDEVIPGSDGLIGQSTSSGGGDWLDFTYYLTNVESESGSAASQVRLPTQYVDQGDPVGPNSVSILTFASEGNQTWANLTASALLTALNGDGDYGDDTDPLDAGKLDLAAAGAFDDIVGNTMHHIVFVENDTNDGEYKVFKLTSTVASAGDDEFASASLLGVIDFGISLDTSVPAMEGILVGSTPVM